MSLCEGGDADAYVRWEGNKHGTVERLVSVSVFVQLKPSRDLSGDSVTVFLLSTSVCFQEKKKKGAHLLEVTVDNMKTVQPRSETRFFRKWEQQKQTEGKRREGVGGGHACLSALSPQRTRRPSV